MSPGTGGTRFEKTGWSALIIVADQGTNLFLSTSHRTTTAWMDPGALLVAGAAVTGEAECRAAGAGARGAGTDGDETSGSESVSMLSHFE